jgi:predicted  nucleic acid-binding Zn ribbon protein
VLYHDFFKDAEKSQVQKQNTQLSMHSLTIQHPQSADENALWHKFYHVLGCLRENGQTLGRDMLVYKKDNRIGVQLWTFTEEALDEKHHSEYVKNSITELELLCENKVEIQHLGYSEEEEKSICHCSEHDYFVLYYSLDFSPIRCGSCEQYVPLFKLPKLHDTRVWDILQWQNAFKACKILDLNCGIGEKWAIKQMCNHDSGLAKQGRIVAEKITVSSGIKTYYFLENYKKTSKQKDVNRPCPSCGDDWHLEQEKFGYFRHKCDTCLLMSSYSSYHF